MFIQRGDEAIMNQIDLLSLLVSLVASSFEPNGFPSPPPQVLGLIHGKMGQSRR